MAAREAVVTLVFCRTTSERFPEKCFGALAGKPLLTHVMNRAAQIGYPVVLCSPEGEPKLQAAAKAHRWSIFQGDEQDVLDRMYQAALAFKAEHLIRVTADCPLIDIEAAQLTVREHLTGGHDFTHYIAEGRAVQVFTMSALKESWAQSRTVRWNLIREHPDQWILRNPNDFRIHEMKFSVDTPEDLARVCGWLKEE